jgi:hypothetical protein
VVDVDSVVDPLQKFIPVQPVIPTSDLSIDAVSSVSRLDDVEELPDSPAPVPDISVQPDEIEAVAIEEPVHELALGSTSEVS